MINPCQRRLLLLFCHWKNLEMMLWRFQNGNCDYGVWKHRSDFQTGAIRPRFHFGRQHGNQVALWCFRAVDGSSASFHILSKWDFRFGRLCCSENATFPNEEIQITSMSRLIPANRLYGDVESGREITIKKIATRSINSISSFNHSNILLSFILCSRPAF